MPTTITSGGMVSGSRQRYSISFEAAGTRSRTQIIVGVSSASISSVVSTESSSEVTIEERSSSSVTRFAQNCPVRPPPFSARVLKSSIDSSGTRKNSPNTT